MTLGKIKDIFQDYNSALNRLKEAIQEDLSKGGVVVDGTIQRFEFSFELAWKLAKAILNYNGIEVAMPRMVLKEAFRAGLIYDGDDWIDMLDDRNRTAHIYDEKQALTIYEKIKSKHIRLLNDFCDKVAEWLKNNR